MLPSLSTPLAAWAALLAAPAAAQSITASAFGPSDGLFGRSVAHAGDVNGDGFPDVIVGAPYHARGGSSAGAASVVSGEWLLRTALGEAPQTSRELRRWLGGAGDPNFGWSVDGGADVDRDGVPDLAVGAPKDDNGPGSDPIDSGSVCVFSGASGLPLATFYGGGHKAQGWSVAIVGDVNADGWADVAAGAVGFVTTASPFPGYVRVFSGEWIARTAAGQPPQTGHLLYEVRGDQPLDKLGQALCGLGDLDRDGHDDFAVGAYRGGAADGGYARVFSGRDARILATIESLQRLEHAGFSVADAGDVNGDGFTDLVVGAPGWDGVGASVDEDHGRVFVHSGEWIVQTAAGSPPSTPRDLWVFTGATAGDRLGTSVAGAGDFDGDGVPDVLAGARQPGGTGYARLFSGSSGIVLWEERGPAQGAQLGTSVAGAGDLDADGLTELLIGAPSGPPIVPGSGELRAVFPRGWAACSAAPNSTGFPARLHALGSPGIARNDLVLVAEPVPQGTLGFFFFGATTQAPQPFFDGYLCVAPSGLRRLASAASLAGSSLTRRADLARPVLASIAPGTTWYFQCLFRDPAAGGSGWGLSDALAVPFAP